MNIVCISDTHSQHNSMVIPEGDMVIHAGDATMIGTYRELENFILWFSNLPHKYKIFVPGNHDWGFDDSVDRWLKWNSRRAYPQDNAYTKSKIIDLCKKVGVLTLIEEGINIEGLNIYGAPHQPEFFNWAFNASDKELKKIWAKVPKNTDILVTHGPPFGIGDTLLTGQSVGDQHLLNKITKLPNLKAHICGHIHCDSGIVTKNIKNREVLFINASMLNDSYRITDENIARVIKL